MSSLDLSVLGAWLGLSYDLRVRSTVYTSLQVLANLLNGEKTNQLFAKKMSEHLAETF
jgi:hypothetical protein